MKLLAVHYCGWGEDWPLGTLADDGRTLLFEYSAPALAQGLELSPRHLKLRAGAYGDFPSYLHRLPGLVADALPDGWGLLLMDRLFRQQGRTASPLERLAFIGDRAMGALRFEPADEQPLPAPLSISMPNWPGTVDWMCQKRPILTSRPSWPALALRGLIGKAPGACRYTA